MTKATLRWVGNPLDKSNQILLKELNGTPDINNTFVTPYVVEKTGEEPVVVKKKYSFDQGELTEYYYEIEGPEDKVRDLCSRSREVAYMPLELTYIVPNPGEMVPAEDLYGVLPIIKVLVNKELYGETHNPFAEKAVEKIVYNYYKNPAYITFTALNKSVLPTAFDILDAYRATLPNPVGTVEEQFYFEPADNGSTTTSSIYVSQAQLADIRSKIKIEEIIGWALLHPTPMPYHILGEWCRAHDYLRETALGLMKRVGSGEEVVVIRNELVHAKPDSLFLDLRARSELAEDRGWFIYKIPEVSLSEDVEKVYEEILRSFGFLKRTIPEYPEEMMLNVDDKYRYAFGLDVGNWLEETKGNIFNETPPILHLEGEWLTQDNLPLTSESLAKVTYAAYRAFGEILNQSLDYSQFTDMITVLPDFSVVLPIYNLQDLKNSVDVINGILENPSDIKAVVCKDLSSCIAARSETLKNQEGSIPFLMEIGDDIVLASNSSLTLVKKPGDFPKESRDENLDPLSPEVQGFFNLGTIPGSIKLKEVEEFSLLKPEVRIVEVGDNIAVNVVPISDKRSSKGYDVFIIPKPEGERRVYIKEIEKIVGELWMKGWFLTNWGRQVYRNTGKLSNFLIRDTSDIKSLNDILDLE